MGKNECSEDVYLKGNGKNARFTGYFFRRSLLSKMPFIHGIKVSIAGRKQELTDWSQRPSAV